MFQLSRQESEFLRSQTVTLRVGGVETLLTPIPPLAEQRRIVAKVDELMALVDTLETQLTTARITAEKLMEAVVAELTAQQTPRIAGCRQRSLSPELM